MGRAKFFALLAALAALSGYVGFVLSNAAWVRPLRSDLDALERAEAPAALGEDGQSGDR
ncbi:hypothetical protein GCM10022198_00370 [Klugiella xanthotipulae]